MATIYTQGRIQNFEGGGAIRKFGAKNAYEFCDVGHFFRKICPTLSTFSQYVPQLGHFLRKICPSWGNFSVKYALAGALSP